ncbi:acetyl-CoA synthetase-like protein, partial [Colletotrichum zoysiae]
MPPPVERCLHEVFAESRRAYPDSIAVDGWDAKFTYGVLDGLSNRLAERLIAHGVEAESKVLIFSPKSAWVVVALLAVLKAGGAFVTLEPAHPDSRLREVIRVSGASVALAQPFLIQRLSDLTRSEFNVNVLDMTDTASSATTRPERQGTVYKTLPRASPSNLAYILFTSGTTGVPRGVEIQHRAVCSSITARAGPAAMNMTQASRALQFSPYCFDAMIDEIFMPLASGACVCVPREDELRDDLSNVINRYAITWAYLTPSVARILDPKTISSTLQTLTLIGEAVLANDIAQWRGNVPQLRNGYGPTETTVICVVGDLFYQHEKLTLLGGSSYIGLPRGCIAWVVDPKNPTRLSPLGAPGELLVEGPNLARGYLDDQDTTSQRWIKSPKFSVGLKPMNSRSGSECQAYRTGDLVCMQSDGSLLYLGRIDGDGQTKLRGQRFELFDVESHFLSAQLQAKLDVREVAAFVFEKRRVTTRSNRVLALAFVPQQDEKGPGNSAVSPKRSDSDSGKVPQILHLPSELGDKLREVRRTLNAILPAYMIPTYYIPISKMPLMPSMKTDRQKLARLMEGFEVDELTVFLAENNASSEFNPPTSATEKKLAHLYGVVLGINAEKISVSEDFLGLGGDSITAMRLAASCLSAGIRGVTTASILKLRTIQALANLATTESSKSPSGSAQGEAAWPFSMLQNPEVSKLEAVQIAADALAVEASRIEDIYPATPLQKALFILGSIHSHAYRGLFVVNIPETLDLALVRSVWTAVKVATPIIRTRLFRLHSSDIWQAVTVSDDAPCRIINSNSLEKHLEHQRSVSAKMTFGSELFSAHITVVSNGCGPKRSYLVINVHHTLYDGWSIDSILKEIQRACKNDACLTKKYCERNMYSRFMRHLVGTDSKPCQLFWREYLSDSEKTFAAFPELKSRESPLCDGTQQPRGALTNSTLEMTSSLPTFELSFTLSVLVYAAWSQLASAYGGSDDVVFGVTSHGRDIPALPHSWDIVGPMIATFPLRVRVPSTPDGTTMYNFVKTIEERVTTITAMGHEHHGLDEIAKAAASGDENRTSSACSFHSLIIVQTPREREPGMVTLKAAKDFGSNTHPYPLVLEALPLPDTRELRITAHYDSSLLDSATVQRLLSQLEHMVHETSRLAQPGIDARLADVNLLSPTDASLIHQEWNASSALPPRVDACVHDLIASRASKQPFSPALHAWDLNLSYAELIDVSSRLAVVLKGRGVRTGRFVVICLERSAWAAISQLAVLKAGGACILLDHKFPKARNQDIIKQSQAKIGIVSNATKDLIAGPESPITPVVVPGMLLSHALSARPLNPLDSSNEPTETPVSPSDAAYCVFTSGSTGSPKGIIIEHSALSTSAAYYGPALGLKSSSRVLNFASCAFDVSVGEVLVTLIHGGCICIPTEDDRMNDLPGCISSLRVNWIYLTSSLAAILKPEDPRISSLKALVVGGEAVQQQLIETWAESNVTLVNAYGPAETTIYCSSRVVLTKDTDARNIGKAMGCRMWIVCPNDHRKLLPIGATGEIVVDGHLLARGYLNMPDVTAASFITSVPFLPEGHRIYRTGDLACYDADGNFHFRGRRDTQVKVNGQRIDVVEIETKIIEASRSVGLAAFIRFNDVQQAKSDTVQAATRVLALTATMSARVMEIHNHLQNALPAYMLPAVYLPIDSLPKTGTDKLDRKVLERLVEGLSDSEFGAFSAQIRYTDTSGAFGRSLLMMIWNQVLARTSSFDRNIDIGDNFFALGGNSLSAMQIVWEARARALSLSVSDLYKNPTVSQLAAAV